MAWPAGFAAGGYADGLPGGGELALLADAAAGPEDRYPGATDGELDGLIAAWDRVEAHAAARKHLAIAEFIRRRPEKGCEPAVPGGMPGRWDEFAADELRVLLAEQDGRRAADGPGPGPGRAVVATLSLVLTGWIFVFSGPRVQARASLSRPPVTRTGRWHVYLQVWNAGRQDIKLDLHGLILDLHSGRKYFMRLNWDGPEVPMMLPAHSGKHWIGRAPDSGNDEILAVNTVFNDYLGADSRPDEMTELRMVIKVGGRRMIPMPVAEDMFITPGRSRTLRRRLRGIVS